MKALDFNIAFKYPFNRPMGMLNILWVFVPIIGWFALGGYGVRIIQNFIKGDFKELPKLEFGNDLSLGFMMFIKAIPFGILYMVIIMAFTFFAQTSEIPMWIPGAVNTLLGILVLPILSINFMKKETVESWFEFSLLKFVFDNLGDYIVMMLKSLVLGIVFLFLSLVLVGIPAGAFTKNMFLADFYRRRVK